MTNATTKPYLLRAIYEWCIDHGYTPHIAVLVDEHTRVPPGYARDGQIVLNLGTEATHRLVMGNDVITFDARFGGVAHSLSIPVGNVVAIYARENGQGMAFEPVIAGEEEGDEGSDEAESHDTPPSEPPSPSSDGRPAGERGSHLKIVK